MTSKGYCDLTKSAGKGFPNTIIGHTRWPTKGGVEMQFVHPHSKKKVIGVHNGTMTQVGYNFIKPSQSDSSMIYDMINDKGFDEMFQTSYGAFCLVWMDKEKQTLNFARNTERPLYLGYVGHKIADDEEAKANCLFWASERLFLEFALRRAGFISENFFIEELPANTLVSFDMAKGGDVSPMEVRKLERRTRTFQGGSYLSDRDSFPRSTALGSGQTNTSKSPLPSTPWRSWEKLGEGVKTGEGLDHGVVINTYSIRYDSTDVTVHVCEYEDGSKSRSNCPAPYWKALESARSRPDGTTSIVNKSAAESAKVFLEDKTSDLADEWLLDENAEEYIDPLEDDVVVKETDIGDMFDKFMGKVNSGDRNFSGHAMETLRGNFVSRKEFYKLISEGCSYCASNSVNPRTVVWHTKSEYLCDNCQMDEEARAMCFLHPLDMH